MVVATAAGRLPFWPALGFLIATYTAFIGSSLAVLGGLRAGPSSFEGTLLGPSVLFGSLFIIGIQRQRQRKYVRDIEEMVVALREYSGQLEAAERQLRVEAMQTAALAAAEERNRIAREIHDVLAHSLTVIVIQAQAIQRLVTSNPPAAEESAATVARLARDGLQEARRSVAALRDRPSEVDGLPMIRTLVEEFGRNTATPTRLAVTGHDHGVSPNVWTSLYRAIQEALTNAQRHGQARNIDVRIELGDPIRLTVEDDGKITTDSPVEPGNGLIGMSERAARLGGSLAYGPRPEGGFRISLELPR
jgi:signal transduction histidine kinase